MLFRTPGPWGAGSGADLAPSDVDNNFYQLVQMIAAKVVTGVGIANIVVSGNEFWVTLTDHAILGPYELPVSTFTFVGQWQPSTTYSVNTIFTEGGSTYMVLLGLTTAPTFDAGANDGMGHNYYGLLLSNAPNALPTGGTDGMALTKFGSTDYVVTWRDPTLAALFDVQQSPGPDTGDLIQWNGSEFAYIAPGSVVGAPPALTALSDVLHSPAPTNGQVPIWNSSSGAFIFGAAGSETLSGLTDVSETTLNNNDVLTYVPGTGWTNLPAFQYSHYNSTTYNLDPSDQGFVVDAFASSSQTFTILQNSLKGFPVGATMWIRQGMAGVANNVTIVAGSGVTLDIPVGRLARPRAVGSIFRLFQTDTVNTWEVSGDLAYDITATTIAGSGGVAIDPRTADSDVYTITPTASETLTASAAPVGKRMTIVVTTSGTTPWTLTFGSGFKSQGTLITGAVSGAVFTVAFVGDGTNMNEISRTIAM